MRTTYAGFLTEEEIQRVIDGKEMYFEGDELAQRLSSYAQYRDALREAVAEEEGVDTDPFDQ